MPETNQTSTVQATTSNQVVMLTPKAQKQVRSLIDNDERDHIGLRLGIKGGGCSGLMYLLDFTEHTDGDTVLDYDNFQVYLDKKSTIYLSGVILDYQGGLNGKGFIFSNPMASNTCGCGESFSI
jgi:iron-sulfur cluster assembly protein